MGQVSPLTPRVRDIKDGVDDLTAAHAGMASSKTLHIRANLGPLFVGQISIVSAAHQTSV